MGTEGFIHDGGTGHGGEPHQATGSLHSGSIHSGGIHAGHDTGSSYAGQAGTEPLGSVSEANQIGNPDEYEHYWFYQHYNGYCVPSSITQVIEAQTGHTMHSYDTVVQEAHALGIPTGESGMTMPQAQELLSHFGVPSHIESPASPQEAINDLANHLEHGRSVILAVNASPIWYGSDTADNPGGHADHALVVSAINSQTGMVTLSDPGSPTGNEEQVPLNVFMDAWNASGDQMIVTDHPAGAEEAQAGPAVQHAVHTAESAGARAGFVLLPIALGVTALNAVRKRGTRP